jgi:plasmid stability protein
MTTRGPDVPNLQIRELPQEIYDALKLDADREQRSLTQQAIVTLRQAQQRDRIDQRSAAIDALRQSQRRFEFSDQAPEDLIAEDRRR